MVVLLNILRALRVLEVGRVVATTRQNSNAKATPKPLKMRKRADHKVMISSRIIREGCDFAVRALECFEELTDWPVHCSGEA